MSETLDKTQETGRARSLANLKPKPWKPGQSGNPNGRPKKEYSLTDGLREYVAETDPDKKKLRKDVLVEKLYTLAQRGDLQAIREVWDRLEGTTSKTETNVNVGIQNIVITDEMLEKEAIELLTSKGYLVTKQ